METLKVPLGKVTVPPPALWTVLIARLIPAVSSWTPSPTAPNSVTLRVWVGGGVVSSPPCPPGAGAAACAGVAAGSAAAVLLDPDEALAPAAGAGVDAVEALVAAAAAAAVLLDPDAALVPAAGAGAALDPVEALVPAAATSGEAAAAATTAAPLGPEGEELAVAPPALGPPLAAWLGAGVRTGSAPPSTCQPPAP
jgi:hypothetical protein